MNITGSINIVATNVKTGKVVDVFENHNLVVSLGRAAAASLLGGDGTNKHVTQIAFGIGGGDPAAGDTDLTDKFIKVISGKSYPEAGSVVFSFSLDETEANGKDIREMGLFTAGNQLFARKNRGLITKTSDVRFDGTWKIKF